MYFVSATRLKLRSVFLLPSFLMSESMVAKQLKITPGFIDGKELMDKNLTFWTLTKWTQDGAMKEFRNSTPHRNAMRRLPDWCDEATYTHWLQDEPELPGWNAVHERIVQQGVVTKLKKPSERHLSRSFPKPQWTRTERIYKGKILG